MSIKFGLMIMDPSPAAEIEDAGFDSIWIPDHFAPFSHAFGSMDPVSGVSCMALPFLPLLLNNTRACLVGTNVLCPILRYHPAIIAQYFAQLDEQFPGRLILGVGTGEAINETPFVGRFPPYRERRDRLREAIELTRKLWTSAEYFDYDGRYYHLKNVFLYAKPQRTIPIVISAFGEQTATLAGQIGDGIILYWGRPQQDRERILQRFDAAATQAGKDPETLMKIAYFQGGVTSDPMTALHMSKSTWSWSSFQTIHTPDPRSIDESAEQLPDDEAMQYCTFVTNGEELITHFESAFDAGINHVILGDMTSVFVAFDLAQPEDMSWPMTVLPYLREHYQEGP